MESFQIEIFQIVEEKINEYTKNSGSVTNRMKGLYLNIFWNTLKYINQQNDNNNHPKKYMSYMQRR